jgi:hypothetical protein
MDRRLERLHALRGTFGPAASRERHALLRALARVRWRDAGSLRAWHDELLFVAAFPDSRAVSRAARTALTRIAARVRALPRDERESLMDSGIAGSVTSHTFNFGAARWLAARHERLTFAWDDPDSASKLDPLLRLALTPVESDRFDSGDVSSTEWLDEAAGAAAAGGRRQAAPTDWLLASPPQTDPAVLRALYDDAAPPLRWELGGSPWSATACRVAGTSVLRRAFRPLPRDPVAHIATPLRGIRLARDDEAARWHDASMGALLARTREVFPTIYANPREIHLAPLGDGVTLCVIGCAREDRSALEANYGYVMFSNGVPIGYGGVTTFGAQANTGANVFESFRRSEAPFLFAQALRAFRTMFAVTRFVVNPYQFGAGNAEAIASGAYWFYDRLGFRPVAPRVAALAARERLAMAEDRAHRSNARTLRSLASGDLVLALPDAAHDGPMPERLLEEAGRLATRAMRTVRAGDRAAWVERKARALRARCGGGDGPLSRAERLGAWHLMPLLDALAPRIARWPARDRAQLWHLVALKGGRQERPFARAATQLPRLWAALERAAADIEP